VSRDNARRLRFALGLVAPAGGVIVILFRHELAGD